MNAGIGWRGMEPKLSLFRGTPGPSPWGNLHDLCSGLYVRPATASEFSRAMDNRSGTVHIEPRPGWIKQACRIVFVDVPVTAKEKEEEMWPVDIGGEG